MSDEVAGPVVPPLHPCVSCGLAVQSGDGPGDLAWHDCDEVLELRQGQLPPPPPPPPGLDHAFDLITQTISARASKMNGRELADIIDALARWQEARNKAGTATAGGAHGASQSLLDFLNAT